MNTLFTADPLQSEAHLTLGMDAAAHVRALRLTPGTEVRVVDGAGGVGVGVLVRAVRDRIQVEVHSVTRLEPPPAVHLMVPVADRDRMLLLAEKAVELGVASWRPVMFRRSRSVAGRGDSQSFARRIRARMASALEQCGGAWLPDLYPPAPLDRVLAAAPAGTRLLLDGGAAEWFPNELPPPVVIAVGPEGGIEESERLLFDGAGFRSVRAGLHTLRFETAAVAGLVLARSALENSGTGGGK